MANSSAICAGGGGGGSLQVRAVSSGRALLQLAAPSPPPPTAQYAVSFDGVDDYLQLPLVRASARRDRPTDTPNAKLLPVPPCSVHRDTECLQTHFTALAVAGVGD